MFGGDDHSGENSDDDESSDDNNGDGTGDESSDGDSGDSNGEHTLGGQTGVFSTPCAPRHTFHVHAPSTTHRLTVTFGTPLMRAKVEKLLLDQ